MTIKEIRNNKNVFERNPKKTIVIIVLFFFLIIDFISARVFLRSNESGNEWFRIFHCYYHHTLKKGISASYKWGSGKSNLMTNSLGFKDKLREKINVSEKKYRILFMGDSFTEGIGVSFDSTFVGILHHQYPEAGILNAAAASYSPKLYYLKTKFLIEEENLRFDELFVFIDISDLQDEMLYRDFIPQKRFINIQNYAVSYLKFNSVAGNKLICPFLLKYFYHANSKDKITGRNFQGGKGSTVQENFFKETSDWTYNDETYARWGKTGAELAIQNMGKLNELCKKNKIRLTIAIYPWPDQIIHKDTEGRQVSIWKTFTDKNQINFINYFPDFISDNDTGVIKKYFIEDDVHWNEEGHKKIADKIITGNYIRHATEK